MFEEYSHLPWHVYGEGEPPVGWQSGQPNNEEGSFVVQVQTGLVPVKPPQGWTLGNLLTGMLQRGIKVCSRQAFSAALIFPLVTTDCSMSRC